MCIIATLLNILQAGINRDDLLIALEPECAAIYCKTACSKNLPPNSSSEGAKYMVIDIGGKVLRL